MIHPSLDTLRAHTADELSWAQRNRVDAHVNQCVQCRTEMDWVNRMKGALSELPVYAPDPVNWAIASRRVENGDVVIVPKALPRSGQLLRRPAVAAFFVLAFAAAASAMVGSTTVRDWFVRLAGGQLPATDAPAVVTDSVQPALRELTLLVAPEDGAITVMIEAPSAATRLRVRLVDGFELEVHATGAAAASRFRSAAGRLIIVRPDSGEIILGLPRSARLITLQADERELLRVQDKQLRVQVRADTVGPEILLPLGSIRP